MKNSLTFALVTLLSTSFTLAGCGSPAKPTPTNNIPPAATAPTTPPEEVAKTPETTPEVTKTTETTPPPAPAPTPIPQKVAPKTSPVPTRPRAVTISMKGGQFYPQNVSITKGQTVVFRNNDTGPRWPASPTLPALDAGRAIQPGETYSYTFKDAGVVTIKDKFLLSPTMTITVK